MPIDLDALAHITPTAELAQVISDVNDTIDDALAGVANLAAGNVKDGVNILGTAGTFTADADAVDTDILAGKTAYVAGVKVTGASTFDVDSSAGDAADTDILLGKVAYVAGAEVIGTSAFDVDSSGGDAVATDIAPGKIAYVAGAEVIGTSVAVDTSDATAVAEDIANGKTAYVNGVKITGNVV
jgi:hypothetical protein